MQKPPKAESLTIEGPAGNLEALLERPDDADPAAVAVVCHPHPLQGGTLHNKVAHMLARAFLKCGFAALRFNFRGVGGSEGTFADGDGEVDDVLAAVAAAKNAAPDAPLWLGGFSFGAAMAVRAAVSARPAGLVSVAPAASRFAGTLESQPDCPWLIVHGEDDEVVPIDESVTWVDSLDPGPEFVVFPETGHFFHGKLVELRETVIAFVERTRS
ncbi:MAG: alpha/beta fold hydrolase [Woeseiaceae bacterium]|nr:alpha/beta fold hydrolase [Woeseiaceae bacterium]